MSVHVTSAVWKRSHAEGSTRLVLLRLADQANDDGWCWPSQETIAHDCKMSLASVKRSLGQLVELGELDTYRRGRRIVNVYRVLVGTPVTAEPPPNLNLGKHAQVTAQSEPSQPSSDSSSGPQVTAHSYEPRSVIEPSREVPNGTSAPAPSATIVPGLEPWRKQTPHWSDILEPRDIPAGWAPLDKPWMWSTPTGDRDQLFEAVLRVCGMSGQLTGTEHSLLSKVVKELRQAGASPGEILTRASRWPKLFRDCQLTPTALVKWWSKLTVQEERAAAGHRCPPHRWVDMGEDHRGRYCLACKTWEKTA